MVGHVGKAVRYVSSKWNSKAGKTISLLITEPNGCDLKDRTEREQMIGNKYLRRWGILIDEPDLVDD